MGSNSTVASVDVVIPTSMTLNASATTIQLGQRVTLNAQVMPNQSGGPVPTGTVQFFVNNSDIGAPVQLSAGEATLSTSSLPAGLDNVGATYSGDTNYQSSGNAILVTVSSSATFSVTANPTAISVPTPGQSGSTTLTFTAENGFSSNGNATIGVTCSGLPDESSCNVSPPSINIATNGTAAATLTIMTTAPSALVSAGGIWRDIGGWSGLRGETLPAISILLFLCGIALGFRGKRRRWGLAFAAVALSFVFASAGCGGGGGGGGGTGPSSPGTPAGSANFTVSVTINGVTQTLPLAVNVQ